MRRLLVIVASTALVVGCGSAPDDDVAAGAPRIVSTSADTVDVTPTTPAMLEPPLALLGSTVTTAAPGETFTIDHLVENLTGTTRTVAATARNATDGVVVDATPSSLRLDPGGVARVTTTIRVPERLENDPTFELVVVFADDTAARASLLVTVAVEARSGDRPELGDDRATTSTDARVVSYVVGNDGDPDGDLDLSTLRIVAGAGRAADAAASPDGTITYEPFANRTGTDVVLYELCDGAGNCDTGALTVTVEGSGSG